ncbi:kinesin-like protein KIF19 [Struthio camelus]|uniref:kinesin-like protein KIF19 n=1 Tax=Struthio camelus TaxID=8801 RepID=UPI0036040E85
MKAPGDTEDQQLAVALRIRPLSTAELEEGASLIAHRLDEQVVVLRDPTEDPDDILRANRSREKSYVFDVAFDSTATQETVYGATTRGLIASVISGYNATVFAYGPTGCGKTYTMLGTDREPGIYARTLSDLFQAIEDASGDVGYEVSMSYLEIYNEMIRDLLNPSLGYLELREDSKGVVQVAGITQVSAINAEEVMRLLVKGNKQRTQEPTAANRTSSRSHAVLQVSVRQRSRRSGAVRLGRLFMVDLAGSERAAQTQNRGQRMKEGAHINRSLLALGNCINALSDKASNKYVNYRDSKLTRLLKDSLGGNSRTVMIAHISPASTAFEESRSTLTYADRARSIRTTVRRNLLSMSYRVAQYGSIVADLRREIQRLKSQADAEPGRPGQGERRGPRCVQAQVRLPSARGQRPEPGWGHQELLGACREQVALRRRRHLLELEGTALHARLEASRHLLTLARWEQKMQRGWRRSRRERKEPYGPGDSERDLDTGDERSDVPEPPDVAAARQSIVALVAEQSRLWEQKAELERHLRERQQRVRRREEALPHWSSSAERREVLGLLRRLHQLELEHAETQPRSRLEGARPSPPAAALQRPDRHRALCARIIQQQRQLIADHRLSVPRPLQQLYETYLRELEGGAERRPPPKGTSLPSIPQAPGVGSPPASDPASARTGGPERPAPPRRGPRGDVLPALLLGARSSDLAPLLKRSPQARRRGIAAPERPRSQRSSWPASESGPAAAPGRGAERRGGLRRWRPAVPRAAASSSTESIAAETARRRVPLSTHHSSPLQQSEMPSCWPSDGTGPRCPGEDSPASSAAGTAVQCPDTWVRARKKVEKREESLDAQRRKRRSRSFEVPGRRVGAGVERPLGAPGRMAQAQSSLWHLFGPGLGQAPLSAPVPHPRPLRVSQLAGPKEAAPRPHALQSSSGARSRGAAEPVRPAPAPGTPGCAEPASRPAPGTSALPAPSTLSKYLLCQTEAEPQTRVPGDGCSRAGT